MTTARGSVAQDLSVPPYKERFMTQANLAQLKQRMCLHSNLVTIKLSLSQIL